MKKFLFFILIFSIIYISLLMAKTPKGPANDEGPHSMDSLFYYFFFRDIQSNTSIIPNLENYVFRFYTYYPALYLIYYPPLFGIMTSRLFLFFGVSLFSVRFTSMIFSLFCLVTLYYLGKELYDKKVGLLSLIILSFSPYFFIFSGLAMLDIPMLFFILLSVILFYKGAEQNKKYFYYFSVVFGLGVLIKYTIIFFILPLLAYLLYRKKFRENLKTLIKSSLVFFAITFNFLIVLIFYRGLDLLGYWTIGEGVHIECSFCPNINFLTHLYFYPLMLFYAIFPLVFLVPIFYFLWKKDFKKENVFLLLILTTYILFFTLLPLKSPKYIIPILPFLSLLFVYSILKWKKLPYFIFASTFVAQLIFSLFFSPYHTFTNESNLNLDPEETSMYLNNNIVKNGNIFLFSDFDNAGLIFNFARLNNFENHVFRLRDCLFENMTTGELKDFVDENNIYFIVSSPEGTSYPHLREWVNNSFERVGIKGNLLIHKSYKRSFEHIERVCQYNCKIRMEICSNFTLD